MILEYITNVPCKKWQLYIQWVNRRFMIKQLLWPPKVGQHHLQNGNVIPLLGRKDRTPQGHCSDTWGQETNYIFTFTHLADAFIQSHLQGCIHILHLHWWHTAHQEFSVLLKHASTGNRTGNLLITKRLLYLLYHCSSLIMGRESHYISMHMCYMNQY